MSVTVLLTVVSLIGLARSLFVLACALLHRRTTQRQPRSGERPLVTVIVPAWNEERVIAACLTSISSSSYDNLEVLVVDDGSNDATNEIASRFEDERLRLLTQPCNCGKAQALDRGLRESRGSIIVTVDADTRVGCSSIAAIIAALGVPGVGAVSGAVLLSNPAGRLARWQAVEYAAAVHLDRRAQALLGCVTTVPGAFGAFRRDALLAVGGFSGRTLAEDTDVTLSLGSSGWRVLCAPEAVAVTEAPPDAAALLRQRTRWIAGNIQCALAHWRAVLSFLPRNVGPGPHASSLWFAGFGYPSFVWSHLVVWLLLPLFLVIGVQIASGGVAPSFAAAGGALAVLDVLVVRSGVAMDRTAKHRWRDIVGQRLAFPFILFAAFILVCWSAMRRQKWEWRRTPRVGLPEPTEGGSGPAPFASVTIPQ